MAKKNQKNQDDQSTPQAAPPTKSGRLIQNLMKVTAQFMSGRGYNPVNQAELQERLRLPPQHVPIFGQVLDNLVQQGIIEFKNNCYAFKRPTVEVVTGVLRVHPRGFGFLQADDPTLYPQDIFIPKHLTQNAVDGDRVEVVVNEEAVSEKGPEGKVVTILSRGRTHIAGIIKLIDKHGDIYAYVPMLGTQQRVHVQPSQDIALKVGDRLVMEVLDWGEKETETACKVSHYLGHISDPSCDIKAAIEEYELRSDFPTKVIEEAESLGNRVSTKDIKAREDIREMECFTIDPDTAKDFDDALTLTKDENGIYHLGVHIADVSHYVTLGSALDEEAKQRCNSTYFPRFCLPMLPPALSENLCSLKADVNRLTASVFMSFDKDGNLLNYRMARTVIKSAKRFSYREAKQVLDGEKKSPHLPTLQLMVELCQVLKKKRYDRGSIEFSLPELVVKVNEQGVPEGTDYVPYDVTHQMVEEFMLKANEMVALHLSELGKDLTYRVHDVPAEENLKDFAVLASAFGFNISDRPSALELQRLFDEALQTPHGPYLATSYIRRMRLAIYSAENIGHYGLGLTHYCHFTSPIRRYVDLVVHRILFGEENLRTNLELIAKQCSEQERISAKAESSVVLLKKLRLLKVQHEKNPYQEYEAVVTRVKNFGFFFEIIDLMLEGFLHVAELDNDYFIFEESKMRLRGKQTGQVYATGDKIHVILQDVDFITLDSKWYLSDVENAPRSAPQKRKKEKRDSSRPYIPKKGSSTKTKRQPPKPKKKSQGTKKKK